MKNEEKGEINLKIKLEEKDKLIQTKRVHITYFRKTRYMN